MFEKYFKFLGMPLTLSEFSVEMDFEKMANDITNNGTINVPGFVELSKEDVLKIFNSCK